MKTEQSHSPHAHERRGDQASRAFLYDMMLEMRNWAMWQQLQEAAREKQDSD